jgi:hypothetical protein
MKLSTENRNPMTEIPQCGTKADDRITKGSRTGELDLRISDFDILSGFGFRLSDFL